MEKLETGIHAHSVSRSGHGLASILLSPHRTLLVTLDLIFLSVSFLGFSWISPYIQLGSVDPQIMAFALIFSAIFSINAMGLGYYERENRFSTKQFFTLAIIAWMISTSISLTLFHLFFFVQVGRIQLISSTAGAFAVVVGFRLLLTYLLRNFSYKYVIFGPNSKITDEIKNAARFSRIGQHYQHVDAVRQWHQIESNSSPQKLLELMRLHGVAEIVLTREARADQRLVEFSMTALRAGYRIVDEVTFYTEVYERYPIEALTENWILFSGIEVNTHLTNAFKRVFDIVSSTLALIVLSPLLILIALLIRITSEGPVLFTQMREGRFCVPFRIYKFRTMLVNQRDEHNLPSTRVNDPRITWVGKIIRPLHLDELPQLWNVLIGEMSIVGPRPEDLRFVSIVRKDVPIYDYRHLLRPGLTGPAQLQLGYTLDTVKDTYKKIAYDLYYVKKHTLLNDLVLILRTVFFLARKSR